MFCEKCGTKLEDNAKACPKCGTPVVALAQKNPAQPEPKAQDMKTVAAPQGQPVKPGMPQGGAQPQQAQQQTAPQGQPEKPGMPQGGTQPQQAQQQAAPQGQPAKPGMPQGGAQPQQAPQQRPPQGQPAKPGMPQGGAQPQQMPQQRPPQGQPVRLGMPQGGAQPQQMPQQRPPQGQPVRPGMPPQGRPGMPPQQVKPAVSDGKKKTSTGVIVLIVLISILICAVIGVGVWYFVAPDSFKKTFGIKQQSEEDGGEVNPDDPQNPGDPQNPDNPTNPDDPQNPDNPTNPDDPQNPDNPTNPDDPGGGNVDAQEIRILTALQRLKENETNARNTELYQDMEEVLYSDTDANTPDICDSYCEFATMFNSEVDRIRDDAVDCYYWYLQYMFSSHDNMMSGDVTLNKYYQFLDDYNRAYKIADKMRETGIAGVDTSAIDDRKQYVRTDYEQRLVWAFDEAVEENMKAGGAVSRNTLWKFMMEDENPFWLEDLAPEDPLRLRYMAAYDYHIDIVIENLSDSDAYDRLRRELERTEYSPLVVFYLLQRCGDGEAKEWAAYIDTYVIPGFFSYIDNGDYGKLDMRNRLLEYYTDPSYAGVRREYVAYMRDHF